MSLISLRTLRSCPDRRASCACAAPGAVGRLPSCSPRTCVPAIERICCSVIGGLLRRGSLASTPR